MTNVSKAILRFDKPSTGKTSNSRIVNLVYNVLRGAFPELVSG